MPPCLPKPHDLHLSLFEHCPLPYLILDTHTLHIHKANAAAAAFLQCVPDALESQALPAFLASATAHGDLKKWCNRRPQPFTLLFKIGEGTRPVQAFVTSVEASLLAVLLVPGAAQAGSLEETLLANMVNETSDVLTAADLEFKPITWSNAAERLYGITREQALGQNVRRYLDIEYNNTCLEEVRHRARTEGLWRGEMLFVRPTDGKRLILLVTFKLIRDSDSTPLHYIVSGADITEQKETEARLRETEKKLQQSEAFYRTLIADSVDGKLLTEADGTITFASPSMQRILGYDTESLVGRNAFAFVHPDDHSVALTAFLNELAQTPEVKSIEVRVLKEDGSWLWCSLRGHNLLSNPHIGRMVISLHDDTQRKQADDALRESEQRFRALIKDLKLGVLLESADGAVLMCNTAMADLMGGGEATLAGKDVQDLFKKAVYEDETPVAAEALPMRHAAGSGQPVKDVVIGIRENDRSAYTWLLVHSNPVLDESGAIRHVISSFTDITERKKLTRHLLEERLMRQRLLTQATIDGQERERKEIGKELHDNIGQQLATTKLYLDMVRRAEAPEATRLLDHVTGSIANVINEVRTLSHSLVPPTLGHLGLIDSIHDLVERVSRVQALAVSFTHEELDETLLPENAKLMLYRIIQEALSNCIKHAQATAVHILLERKAGGIALQVQDNGRGFVPGSTRTGLGLNNMRNRAEVFGGSVAIHSAPGAGCTVQVQIPELCLLQDTFSKPHIMR